MKRVESVDELVAHLRDTGDFLFAPENLRHTTTRLLGEVQTNGDWTLATSKPGPVDGEWGPGGLSPKFGQVEVPAALYERLNEQLKDEESKARRHSSWPIERAFVFVDVSDFSKLPSGTQLLVVLALVRLANESQDAVLGAEAQLCIGDGYIYVFSDSVMASFFAADFAKRIELAVAEDTAPDFHFRIGVHVGEVRCFWDPGRQGWNYVGDGINGAQRVLAAIGKETDDVVYVSAQVRQRIQLSDWEGQVLTLLDNMGRKEDKHGNHWRVYRMNHTAWFTANAKNGPG